MGISTVNPESWKGHGQTFFVQQALTFFREAISKREIASHSRLVQTLTLIEREVPEFQMWTNTAVIVENASRSSDFDTRIILRIIDALRQYLSSVDEDIAREFSIFLTSTFAKSELSILTHCHSGVVVGALIGAAKHFPGSIKVYVTETRPKLNGNRTAQQLATHGIPTTFIVDAAVGYAMNSVDAVVLGADAIDSIGSVMNRVGSDPICNTAKIHRRPVYALSQVLKYRERLLCPECIFRLKAASDSGSKRPPVPVQSGHRFRLNPATIWTGPECEVTLDNYSEMGQDISFKRRHKWPERGCPCEKSKKPCG